MNINFEAALRLINIGAYDEAQKNLRKAIDEENANGSERTAIEYACVLGDLLANLDDEYKAKAEFDKVIEYCDRTNSLSKQRKIAADFITAYNLKNKPNSTQTSPYEQ